MRQPATLHAQPAPQRRAVRRAHIATALLLALVACAATGAYGAPVDGTPSRASAPLLFSPYKDVSIAIQPGTHVLQSRVTGTLLPLVGADGLIAHDLPGLHAVTLAFATGTCGAEHWGKLTGPQFARANIPALAAARIGYIVATGGGNGGTFTCATPHAFIGFVQRYLTSRLLGIDFDIESGQTATQIHALVADAAAAAKRYPRLRFIFTLATFAGADGTYNGLNPLGTMVVKTIQASRLRRYVINLMVMDYDKPGRHECVMAHGVCAMGASALQAVRNLQHTYGMSAAKIALTPMIGNNDTPGQYFTLANVDTVVHYARTHHLAGMHFWSLDRDTPCSAANAHAASTPDGNAPSACNTEPGVTPLAYTRRALRDLGR